MNKNKVILAGACLMFSSISFATPIQWTTASGGNDHYYDVLAVPDGIGWQDASTAATSLGGYLATSTSAAENDFIFSLVNNAAAYWWTTVAGSSIGPWLGGLQPVGSTEPSGGWSWVTGEAFSFTNWATDQPNDAPIGGFDEDRISLLASGAGATSNFWNDLAANGPLLPRAYVVEFDDAPVPTPGVLALFAIGLAALGYRRNSHLT